MCDTGLTGMIGRDQFYKSMALTALAQLGMFYVFYEACLFYGLEDLQLVNINDIRDIYALHFVFIPIIQLHLDLFKQGWAHHALRTETPLQLWISGLYHQQSSYTQSAAVSGLRVSLFVHEFILPTRHKDRVGHFFILFQVQPNIPFLFSETCSFLRYFQPNFIFTNR